MTKEERTALTDKLKARIMAAHDEECKLKQRDAESDKKPLNREYDYGFHQGQRSLLMKLLLAEDIEAEIRDWVKTLTEEL